ncbi:MAG: tetratricopeptide repeat protein [Desulfocapsaceae bacterium]|nr:tetratricopeptide repeat protein [Desulfocapsaceae bacterium]
MNRYSQLQNIITLDKSETYTEMEKACRQLLKKLPSNFDALQLLGLGLVKQGRHKEAVRIFKKALKKNNSHAGTHINLGHAYNELGKYPEALLVLQKAIKLDPRKAVAYNNLGITLFHTKKYQESIDAYNHAIKLTPHYAQAINNLGVCFMEMGLLHEAIEQFLKANDLEPLLTSVYIQLFQALELSHIIDDALHVAQKGLEIISQPSWERLKLLMGIAIITWISGQIELSQKAINQSNFAASYTFPRSRDIEVQKTFRRYLEKLLQIRREQPQLYTGNPEHPLFFVGESHCLSPSETVIVYQKKEFRVLSTFIQGCKAWHLGQSERNKYKKSLEILFKSLPTKSKLVVGMGEIDCRLTEGIIPAYLEKGIDFHSSIPELVEKYVKFVSDVAKRHQHTLIFYGVPTAPKTATDSLAAEAGKLLQNVIRLFNKHLEDACNSRGWEILDVYGLTTGEDGEPNSQFHIDSTHLHPNALAILFQSHLIASKLSSDEAVLTEDENFLNCTH